MFMDFSQGTSELVTRDRNMIKVSINTLSTFREDWLLLEMSLPDLEVVSNYLETDRNQNGAPLAISIPDMHNMKASFDIFDRIKELNIPVPDKEQGYYRRMLLEAIVAAMQAEVFFIHERGFESHQQYDQFWNEYYKDNCRYYSNLHRVQTNFTDYLEDQKRDCQLFSRQKHAHIEETEENNWRIVASLRDSFHEMHTSCAVDPESSTVIKAYGKIHRAPDQVCFESSELLEQLAGMKFTPEYRKNLREKAAGPQGCAHFGDLVVDSAFLLAEVRDYKTV